MDETLDESQRFQVEEARDILGTWDEANPGGISRETVLADQVRALLAIIDQAFPAEVAEQDAEADPFDNAMHFTESLCPSGLGLVGGGVLPCHLEVHHNGPHSDIDGHIQWVGTGDTARTIEPSRSPVTAGNRMRAALGYDRQAHLAWYDQRYPLRIDWPPRPRNEAATLAAIAGYADGQVTP